MSTSPANPSGQKNSENAALMVALDLALQLNEQEKHQAAAMLFCNELAFHFKAVRVSLGWIREDVVEIIAVSNTNSYERRLEALRDLESAMQEAADQDEDILWPAEGAGARSITREHEALTRKQAIPFLMSLPLRLGHKVCGVVTLQRQEKPFREGECDVLRLICDLSVRRLDDLDRWGRSWWRSREVIARERLAQFVGPEHTWVKAGAIGGALLLAFLLFWPMTYRVEGNFTLKTEALINLPAPYDGFIKTVGAIPGDEVKKNQVLMSLDTTDLKLQESESLANMQRFQSEAQLAQGDSRVSEMHIKLAQSSQNDSKLRQIRYGLERSEMRSPFDGVVVEGSLRERIGAPVQKGDILMKVSRLEDLYVQVEVSEKDIQEIKEGKDGAVRFTGRPEDTFPIKVTRVEPAAVSTQRGNFFIVRCEVPNDSEIWWRPGMTGVAKIEAGRRSPLYIISHRFLDFLRLRLWF